MSQILRVFLPLGAMSGSDRPSPPCVCSKVGPPRPELPAAAKRATANTLIPPHIPNPRINAPHLILSSHTIANPHFLVIAQSLRIYLKDKVSRDAGHPFINRCADSLPK